MQGDLFAQLHSMRKRWEVGSDVQQVSMRMDRQGNVLTKENQAEVWVVDQEIASPVRMKLG